MFNQFPWKPVCAALALAGLLSFRSIAAEKDLPPASRVLDAEAEAGEAFMHAKLTATHLVVDGLAYEDFGQIEKGADELLQITELASWKVRRDPVYMGLVEV